MFIKLISTGLVLLAQIQMLWGQIELEVQRNKYFDIVFKQDFSLCACGQYFKDEWAKDWNSPKWANNNAGYGYILQEGQEQFLKEGFAAGTFGLNGSGTQWHAVFQQGYDELFFSYKVRFSKGFLNPNLHGKLPGLAGGTANGGGSLPNGKDGWSARYMFHGTEINFYLYYPDLYKAYGDLTPVPGKKYYGVGPILKPGFTLQPDVWYTLTQRIVLNTPGEDNGFVEGFINGRLCARQTGIRFRDTDSLKIDRIFFSNFLGGSGVPPSTDESICFDNFFVYTYKQNLSFSNKKQLSPVLILLPDFSNFQQWSKSMENTSVSGRYFGETKANN